MLSNHCLLKNDKTAIPPPGPRAARSMLLDYIVIVDGIPAVKDLGVTDSSLPFETRADISSRIVPFNFRNIAKIRNIM